MIWLAITVGMLAVPQPEPTAQPRYFLTLYAGQAIPFKPRTAHTWATFTKITPMPDQQVSAESVTISWLPVTADVHPMRLRPEHGKNFSLGETFAIAASHEARVSHWGPYEISAERYTAAVAHVQFLESGIPKYRVFDTNSFNPSVMHCVHAVTTADPVFPKVDPSRVSDRGTRDQPACSSVRTHRCIRRWPRDARLGSRRDRCGSLRHTAPISW